MGLFLWWYFSWSLEIYRSSYHSFLPLLVIKNGSKVACQHLASFFNTPSYNLLFAGLIIVLVVSRIIGMRFMVHIISGPHFSQGIKSFLEEGTELLGYLIIFTSSLSYCLVPETHFSILNALTKPLAKSDVDCEKGHWKVAFLFLLCVSIML